ncbi:YafY family transcriptional regulator [Panacibacter ginsenosidivorans]|uniref:YafY family transcriptional regulator n=1 Tax=Panacibacter ginsenosidivorans TaxID=1813871 RepID=A0A5B8V4V5_9BACT|nr:YafY family protein [Panacibacter ginsenosidivorans]QEC66424.1 YafY family transcriptional regulator [Panacibacter ginsenosidivorans]
MNRIDRVTAILIQLQSKKIVKAQDIADRFQISLRTVYRDVKTLEEAGIPIIGEAGVGYSIMDGYRLPPVMFTKEEATAFLTAEKIIEKFTDASTEASYKSAMYKVRAVLRNADKELLENMEDHIQVIRNVLPFDAETSRDRLQPFLKSIVEQKIVHVRYTAFHSDETTERDIEPVGIFYASGYWHVIAYCRMRKDYRDFRADRINSISLTDESFHTEHPTLKNYLEKFVQQQQLEKIVINVERKAAKYLEGQKHYYGFVNEQKVSDKIQMTFLSASSESFIRWYIMFADHAEIVYPDSLKETLKNYLRKMADKFL